MGVRRPAPDSQDQYLQWNRLNYLHPSSVGVHSGNGSAFYRPLLSLWFLINKSLLASILIGFHVTTVLTHVTATGLRF